MIDVLTVRGTGEHQSAPANMLAHLTPLLDPARYRVIGDVVYPASIGPANPAANIAGCSLTDSVEQGVAAVAAAVRAAQNPVGLCTYSLGGIVGSRFLEAKAAGQYADCEIAWAAFVANPLRAEGDSIDPDPAGFGLAGQHGPWPAGLPTWHAANPLDGITSCAAGSPLRTVADGMSAFSFAELGGWTLDLAARMRAGRWQPTSIQWWQHPVRTASLYVQAARQIEGYVAGGQHTVAYVAGGYLERLAARINAWGQ